MGRATPETPPALACPPRWSERLRRRLDEAAARGRARRAGGAPPGLVDFSTNDSLGLRTHPRLVHAVERAAGREGVGAGASRLVGGRTELHERVERRFAAFKGAEDARLLPTGFHANLSALGALVAPGDLLLLDKRCHASLIDAATLACARGVGARGAAFRTFPHADLDRAEELANRWLDRAGEGTLWLVAESVYSMDGDPADLPALGALRDRVAARAPGGAALLIDEAHATGALGPGGAGLDAAYGHVADVVVSTASKALGGLGGVITGPIAAIAAIDHFARAFIYTTGAAPPLVGALDAALDVLRDEPERRERLSGLIKRVRAALRAQGWDVAPGDEHPTPIIPLPCGREEEACALSERLGAAGLHAPAIRPPTVPPGASRVRLSLSAAHTDDQIDHLLRTLAPEAARRPR